MAEMKSLLNTIWKLLIEPPSGAQAVRSTMWSTITDIGLIIVIIGIFLRIFGEENASKKLTGFGFLGALIAQVISLYV